MALWLLLSSLILLWPETILCMLLLVTFTFPPQNAWQMWLKERGFVLAYSLRLHYIREVVAARAWGRWSHAGIREIWIFMLGPNSPLYSSQNPSPCMVLSRFRVGISAKTQIDTPRGLFPPKFSQVVSENPSLQSILVLNSLRYVFGS